MKESIERQKGLTIIELIVSLTIFSAVLLILYNFFSEAAATSKHVSDNYFTISDSQWALNWIIKDSRQSQILNVPNLNRLELSVPSVNAGGQVVWVTVIYELDANNVIQRTFGANKKPLTNRVEKLEFTIVSLEGEETKGVKIYLQQKKGTGSSLVEYETVAFPRNLP